MGFGTVSEYARSYEEGRFWKSFINKTGSPILPAGGYWGDLSMAAGTPKYNAWVGTQLQATPMIASGNSSIYVGENVAPLTKHLNRINIQTNSATFAPAIFLLNDYLMFYPLVDCDSTDLQECDNSTPLPRIVAGAGVQMALITSVPQTGNANCTIVYTNQDGVPGRTTTFLIRGPTNVGNLNVFNANANGAAVPQIPLQPGDFGVQSVQTIQFDASAGGFVTLLLYETLGSLLIREQNTVCEHYFFRHKPSLPRIYDGAFLNYFFSSSVAAISSLIRGELEVYWN